MPTVKNYRGNDYVIFLRGLNDQFSAIRSQIMLIQPLPSINKVFSTLIQQHRQMQIDIPSFSANTFGINTESRIRGRWRGFRGNTRSNTTGRSYAFGRGRCQKSYTYCQRLGHTIDSCYKKHGYPPSSSNNNNLITEEDGYIDDPSNSDSSTSDIPFTDSTIHQQHQSQCESDKLCT
ncbi:hypothetical protein Lalb_Chr23g0273741 [Lupinus albus]|uniref:Uncharacterized protein n=1 Tax=Lupinus albus TaxID=3870 RepID=A0A6A4NJF9_LUPAL|nr:hypothetical protein Lalb_Chr23g0273741 [Lupinus albus]